MRAHGPAANALSMLAVATLPCGRRLAFILRRCRIFKSAKTSVGLRAANTLLFYVISSEIKDHELVVGHG